MPRHSFRLVILACVSALFVFSYADVKACPEGRAVIFFSNGILTLEDDAESARLELERKLQGVLSDQAFRCLEFEVSYNATRLPEGEVSYLERLYNGSLDTAQALGQNVTTFSQRFWTTLAGIEAAPGWLQEEFLRSAASVNRAAIYLAPEIVAHQERYEDVIRNEEKKVLAVGHSQGNFYANQTYFLMPEEIKQYMGIVSVATFDSFVAGQEQPYMYTNLAEDLALDAAIALASTIPGIGGIGCTGGIDIPIDGVELLNMWPLCPNITNTEESEDWKGHNFNTAYLVEGSNSEDKILGDVFEVLNSLPNPNQTEVPPDTIVYSNADCGTSASSYIFEQTHGDRLLTIQVNPETNLRFDAVNAWLYADSIQNAQAKLLIYRVENALQPLTNAELIAESIPGSVEESLSEVSFQFDYYVNLVPGNEYAFSFTIEDHTWVYPDALRGGGHESISGCEFWDTVVEYDDHFGALPNDSFSATYQLAVSFIDSGHSTSEPLDWTVFSSPNEPLSGANSIEVAQNNDIWIGTQEGLVRFDGISWSVHHVENPRFPNGCTLCDWVDSVAIDSDGSIWASAAYNVPVNAYERALAHYQNGTWTIYDPSNSGLPGSVNDIAIDADGVVWIATHNQGLVRFDGTVWTVWNASNSDIHTNHLTSITIDDNGVKWIGTQDGIVTYDGVTWTTYDRTQMGITSNISTIRIDTSGNKWVGTGEGLVRFDDSIWTLYNLTGHGFASNTVESISIDSLGNKWIGGWGGIIKIENEDWIPYLYETEGWPNGNPIHDIAIDQSGNVWIAGGYWIAIGN